MADDAQYKLGKHDAQIDALDKRIRSIEEKLDEALSILNQAKGGWRTLVAIGGLFSALGAFAGWVLHYFFGKS